MLADESPFLHLQRRSKLFSKFQGPLLSTHSIWNLELNLNCKTLFPTSTILKSDPIFQADLKVLLRAFRFCCLSKSKCPNKLSEHSSSNSGLLIAEIAILSSSSFVSCRFCKLSTIPRSILSFGWILLSGKRNPREKLLYLTLLEREKLALTEREKLLHGRERSSFNCPFSH